MMTTIEMPSARSRRAIVLALCLAAFIISVDVTIVNVALPTLVRTLGASTTELQWVVDAYSLVFAALVLAAGSLSDRQGGRGHTAYWPGGLRLGEPGRRARQHHARAHRRSGRHGTGSCAHVPLHALAPRERLYRTGRTRQSHRPLGSNHWRRDRDRPNRRGLVARALLVGKHLRLHGPRRRGGRGPRRHSGPGAARTHGRHVSTGPAWCCRAPPWRPSS